jgi:hypothetical protein
MLTSLRGATSVIRLLVAVALAGVFGGLLFSSAAPEGARTQAGGEYVGAGVDAQGIGLTLSAARSPLPVVLPRTGTAPAAGLVATGQPGAGPEPPQLIYVGGTADGRAIRLTLSDDSTQILSVLLTDPDPAADPAGGVVCGVEVASGFRPEPWPITNGRFEIEVGIGWVEEIGTARIVGEFLPGARVSGTYEVTLDDPPCATGEMPWSGDRIVWPGWSFPGQISQGGSVHLVFSGDGGFVASMTVEGLDFKMSGCPSFAKAGLILLNQLSAVPVRVTEEGFEISGTAVSAGLPPIYEFTAHGQLTSETDAEGTVRISVLNQPTCDTGVLTWTAQQDMIPASPTAVGSVSPEPTGPLPVGGSAPPESQQGVLTLLAIGAALTLVGLFVLVRQFPR